ncbi:hypothetical protein PC123_g9445 [Phytophthora cactorum]|nr:hypothetical protein PC123_g9445 [Phytophthora cactorum]
MASAGGHLAVARVLLESGADPDIPARDSYAPLTIAALRGHADVVGLLMEYKACLDIQLCCGSTALGIINTCENGMVDTAEMLLQGGASVNLLDNEGWSPLMIAVINGRDDITRLLLEHKADVNVKGPGQTTALRAAAELGYVEVVRALIYSKASLNDPSEDGETPLFIAAKKGHHEIVQLLVNQGADLNRQSHGCHSAADGCDVQPPGIASHTLGCRSERGFEGLLRLDSAIDGVF